MTGTAGRTDAQIFSNEDLRMIDQAWENHKASLPVAVVINDNQLGRTAIIEITIDPPTLQVGTKLYAGPKAISLGDSSVTPEELAEEIRALVKLKGGVVSGATDLAKALLSIFAIERRETVAAAKPTGDA